MLPERERLPRGLAGDVRTLVPGLDVKTWRQLVPTLASMLDSARSAMIVMFVIVILRAVMAWRWDRRSGAWPR